MSDRTWRMRDMVLTTHMRVVSMTRWQEAGHCMHGRVHEMIALCLMHQLLTIVGGRDAVNDAVEAAAEEAMRRRTALAEARKDAKAARDKQRDEELKRLMKECGHKNGAPSPRSRPCLFKDQASPERCCVGTAVCQEMVPRVCAAVPASHHWATETDAAATAPRSADCIG